jgi:hypothetical protein
MTVTPELLDAGASAGAAASGFARLPAQIVEGVVGEVGRDLRDGTWDARCGRLREIAEDDAGLRLVVA